MDTSDVLAVASRSPVSRVGEDVLERDLPRAHVGERRRDAHEIVVARAGVQADAVLRDGEADPPFLHFRVAHSVLAHEVGAADLAPDEVVGMIHHLHLVGFGVTDADVGGGRRHQSK